MPIWLFGYSNDVTKQYMNMIGQNLTARPTAVGYDYRALKIAVGFEKLFIFYIRRSSQRNISVSDAMK